MTGHTHPLSGFAGRCVKRLRSIDKNDLAPEAQFLEGAKSNQPVSRAYIEQHLARLEAGLCEERVPQLSKPLKGGLGYLLVSSETSFSQPLRPFVMLRH